MSQEYIKELKKSLDELKPYKAILFGSYAHGTPHEESDIDLIVVLNTDELPKSFNERMKNYSAVRNYFRDLSKKVGMDLIVYTKSEWELLREVNNSFYREIRETGRSLL